ncbi:MAG: hypothetical protein KDC38_18930 [Planctomycetes bacterium]|nr:hypothetical protein [Planctomycetota bacterium]
MKRWLIVVLIALSGCHAPAWRRIGHDAFVVATAPLQIPVMAARDAAINFDEPATSTLLFPITFPLFVIEHTALSLAHAGDLLIFPAHFFSDRDSLKIYREVAFPLRRGPYAELFSDGLGTVLVVVAGFGIPVLLWVATGVISI